MVKVKGNMLIGGDRIVVQHETVWWELHLDFRKQIVYKGVVMYESSLPPIHPGDFLAETLRELGLSQAQFARAIGVSPMRVSHVIKHNRPVTAELALLFGRALGQSPQYWLNLQAAYDLKQAQAAIGKRLLAVADLAEGYFIEQSDTL